MLIVVVVWRSFINRHTTTRLTGVNLLMSLVQAASGFQGLHATMLWRRGRTRIDSFLPHRTLLKLKILSNLSDEIIVIANYQYLSNCKSWDSKLIRRFCVRKYIREKWNTKLRNRPNLKNHFALYITLIDIRIWKVCLYNI